MDNEVFVRPPRPLADDEPIGSLYGRPLPLNVIDINFKDHDIYWTIGTGKTFHLPLPETFADITALLVAMRISC